MQQCTFSGPKTQEPVAGSLLWNHLPTLFVVCTSGTGVRNTTPYPLQVFLGHWRTSRLCAPYFRFSDPEAGQGAAWTCGGGHVRVPAWRSLRMRCSHALLASCFSPWKDLPRVQKRVCGFCSLGPCFDQLSSFTAE